MSTRAQKVLRKSVCLRPAFELDEWMIRDCGKRARKKGNYFACLPHKALYVVLCALQSKQNRWASIITKRAAHTHTNTKACLDVLLSYCTRRARKYTRKYINKYYILIRWKYDRLNAMNGFKRENAPLLEFYSMHSSILHDLSSFGLENLCHRLSNQFQNDDMESKAKFTRFRNSGSYNGIVSLRSI